ncbi:transposase [Streptomyces sp. NPDC020800]|uniref:transposase n=1 Tax=Streptomyces sp. NPDC020800 TaxID=3365092 RepID=UPI0037938EDE
MWVRIRLDGLWCDEDLADWYPRDGRPGVSPAQLATVCVMQFLLGLSDHQAAEAVRYRIDFKYARAPIHPDHPHDEAPPVRRGFVVLSGVTRESQTPWIPSATGSRNWTYMSA